MKEERKLIGKKIIKAEIIELYENIDRKYDDKPILKLTMEDGSIFEIKADYGGYTGDSEDEYPRFISVIKKEKELLK